MKKLLLLIITTCIASSGAWAQTSSVSATITDSTSQAYANGTYDILFRPAPGVPGNSTQNGSAFTKHFSGVLDASGAFAVTLTRNDFIQPGGSQWTFTICPLAASACFTSNQTIAAASINLTSALHTVTPIVSVFSLGNIPSAYSSSEIVVTPNPGSFFWNLTTGTFNFWNGASWTAMIVPTSNITFSGNNSFTGSNTFKNFEGIAYVDAFGAVCDGVTNDTTPIQNAINSTVTSHAPVMFPAGKVCVANVTLSTGESLIGPIAYQADYSGNMTTTLKSAVAGSAAVVTIASGATNVSVANLLLSGNGSGSLDRGVWAANSTRLYVQDVGCSNFGEECTRWEAGIAFFGRNIFAVNSLLNRTRSVHSGVVYMGGTDGYLFDSEITASVSREGHIISASGFVDAIVDVGTNNWIVNTVGEISDEGIYSTDAQSHLMGNRVDLNYGHGIECGSPFGGNVTGLFTSNNSQDTTNTYDNVHCTAGNGQWSGLVSNSTAVKHPRYAIFDSQTSSSSFNIYEAPRIAGTYDTASYNISTSFGAHVQLAPQTCTIADGVTTPNIDQCTLLIASAASGQTWTSFLNGIPGQSVIIIGNPNVTIQHNGSTFANCSSANETHETNKAYTYTTTSGSLFREVGCLPKNGNFAGTLQWGGGSSIASSSTVTQTIGTGNVTTAGTAISTLTTQDQTGITVTGALVGDSCTPNIPAALPATWQTGIIPRCDVTSSGTVTVHLTNPTAGSITPAAIQVNVRVTR